MRFSGKWKPQTTILPDPDAEAADDGPWSPLPRSFYLADPAVVARGLLGRFIVHIHEQGRTVGRIVETEAYGPEDDAAAHVHGGRRTSRTEVFWKAGGHAYVYRIYGVHECFNVVTGPAGVPTAVLIRALEPVDGVALMAKRRGLHWEHPDAVTAPSRLATLTSGPGNLARAMGIRKSEHYGHDLTHHPLFLTRGIPVPPWMVGATPRVGVARAGADADRPWRYILRGSPFVSKA